MRLTTVTHSICLTRWTGPKLRIAMVADLHACRRWMPLTNVQSITAQANALNADLIALMGDYAGHVWGDRSLDPEPVATALALLTAPLGVWAVMGNHDWKDDRAAARAGRPTKWHAAFAKAGLMVLNNRHETLTHGDQRFVFAGIDSQRVRRRRFGPFDGFDDVDAALANAPEGIPRILLAHEPDLFPELPQDVDLTLSGHTHAGQIRLAGRPWVVPSRHGRRYAYGAYRERAKQLVVSAGLGCSGPPVRLNCPPELTIVEVSG